MTTATAGTTEAPVVSVTTLADGLVVRLAGAIGTGEAGLLREALLRPRPAACKDILVDAGAVDAIDDEALAVLVAASVWADENGGHLSYTRLSRSITSTATGLGVMARLPMLPPPGTRQN